MYTADRQLTDQGKERKQQLLDCARTLFTERGYGATRVADICEAAVLPHQGNAVCRTRPLDASALATGPSRRNRHHG
jgi:Bacterial regulatory proteins, tetR family